MIKLKSVLGLVASLTLALSAMADDGFVGKWTITQEAQGQQRVSTVTIGDNTGTWEGQRGSTPLANVKIENDKLTFSRTMERDGQEFTIEYEATLVDGRLTGKMITPRGEREFTAVRASDKPTFVGHWDIDLEIQGNPIQAKLDITEADGTLKGHWSSPRGESDLDNVAIKDDALTFSRKMERDGQEFTIGYTAKIVDGKLAGTMVTPMSEMPFTGTQGKATADGEDAAAKP